MIGRRFPDGEWVEDAGGYSKHFIRQKDGTVIDCWMVRAPNGGANFLIGQPTADGSKYHWVQEHEDGTITVRPQPEDAPPERRNSNSIKAPNGWHGYIDCGVWRSV